MRRDDVSLTDPPPNDRPGDRWMCGRFGPQSPCSHGPNRHGLCPLADACRPQPTWHNIRRRISIGAIVVFAITLFIISQTNLAPHVFKPGELTTPHAQILSGTLTSARCASCHPDAATSPLSWFASGGEGHEDVGQTDRCLDCHHNQIDPQRAKLAHNLPTHVRDTLRLASTTDHEQSWHDRLPGPAVQSDNIECAACHREHRGADADLTAVTDSQCQTCHADRFGDFATSHPDWTLWPYGRGGDIAFNHASHAYKHFPATVRDGQTSQFQCSVCHTATAGNEIARTASYETACQSCHDESLRIEAAEGIELLALPSLPVDAAETIKPWPESATGFHDGQLAPLTELLLRSNKRTAEAARRIPNRDFSRIDKSQTGIVEATITVAKAHRELLEQIDREGQSAIIQRAAAVGVAESTMQSLIQSLPTQLVGDAHRRWFGQPEPPIAQIGGKTIAIGAGVRPTQFQNIASPPPSVLIAAMPDDQSLLAPDDGDSLLLETLGNESSVDDLLNDDLLSDGGELLGGDPLSGSLLEGDPLSIEISGESGRPKTSRFDAAKMLPFGGWYRDDLRLAIAYRGGGHSDAVLRSAVDMLSELPDGDPVRQRLLATRGIAACVRCHPSATMSRGAWHSQPTIGRGRDLTRFSHSPHLKIAGMAHCVHCHQLKKTLPSQINLVSDTGTTHSDLNEFTPLTKETCAACHTAQAAGDACIKCHRYHTESPH